MLAAVGEHGLGRNTHPRKHGRQSRRAGTAMPPRARRPCSSTAERRPVEADVRVRFPTRVVGGAIEMREVMFKVIVERPRHLGGKRQKVRLKGRWREELGRLDDMAWKRERIRQNTEC